MPDYPGLGLDLRHRLIKSESGVPTYPVGIHIACDGATSEMIFVREVAMMIIMDRLTDKADWNRKVFDEDIVSKWTSEALALPVEPFYKSIASEDMVSWSWHTVKLPKTLLDEDCINYFIKELRQKARFFNRFGLVPTLDACATAVKSDGIVPQCLHDSLRSAFNELIENTKSNPDFHPGTNEMVRNLVHPSLFPLVYGRTRVFHDEVVGVSDAVYEWSGKGNVIPRSPGPSDDEARFRWAIPPSYWSDDYQWLPANVKFVEGDSVKFTSYINNLHPVKYRNTYSIIESLIEKALPAWDFCLVEYGDQDGVCRGRRKCRFPIPDDPDDENGANWDPSSPPKVEPDELAAWAENAEDADGYESYDDEGKEYEYWREKRNPVQPAVPPYSPIDYDIPDSKTLRSQYTESGLQIIVKMSTIELTPEKPTYPAGSWHVEGQMNEHIVGTAIYYLESENITPSHLAFRMLSEYEQYEWQHHIGQDSYKWMEHVIGAHLGAGGSPCLQNYGSVETKEGRLLAFPNVFQHRVSGFELADKTRPGHRRIIVLWLVDPRTRIISTANVPPQQGDWWVEQVFGDMKTGAGVPPEIARVAMEKWGGEIPPDMFSDVGNVRLPAEVMSMVRDEMDDGEFLMSLDEAREHRRKLMEERSGVQGKAEKNWRETEYNFCEH